MRRNLMDGLATRRKRTHTHTHTYTHSHTHTHSLTHTHIDKMRPIDKRRYFVIVDSVASLKFTSV